MSVLKTGQKLGRFVIQSMVGGGGMAHIYLARDDAADRTVALKVPRLSDLGGNEQKWRTRFAREAKTLMRLRHRAIIDVYDFDALGPVPYFAMEYFDGATALEWGKAAKPTQRDWLLIGRELCD